MILYIYILSTKPTLIKNIIGQCDFNWSYLVFHPLKNLHMGLVDAAVIIQALKKTQTNIRTVLSDSSIHIFLSVLEVATIHLY